jgi:hypothetical protein
MKYQINKVVLLSAITIATTSTAYAGCEWTNGSLGQTVEMTSKRLKLYSECKTDCKQLETGLNNTISLMNTASECGAGVLTAKNSQMVEFFNRRFKLIRKLKTGQSYTISTTTSKPVQATNRETQMNISSGSYQALWTDDKPRAATAAPQPVQIQSGETRMDIAPDAYQALWLDDDNSTQRSQAQRQQQQAIARQKQALQAAKAREIQLAQQRQNEQQRQAHLRKVQLQKQAQIQLQNQRNAEARKRQIILAQQQERVRQKQLQHQRARALHIAKLKARQQQFDRANN